MRIDISGHHFSVIRAVKSYAELRMRDTVGYLEARIDTLCVRLVKVNGGTSGDVTRCRLVAHLFTGPPICSVATDADPYLAIDRAAAGLYDGLEAAAVHRLTPVSGHSAPLYAHPRSLPSASGYSLR